MPKFVSIQHEVTAVQWKGEVTPEVQALFGPGVEITVKTSGDPKLAVPSATVADRMVYADIGDWVVRTDYDESVGGGFDLDVMEPSDFGDTYTLVDTSPKINFSLDIPIPAKLTLGDREAETTLELRLSGLSAGRDTLDAVVAQLVPQLKGRDAIVGLFQSICADTDPDTLVAVRDAIEQIMVARSRPH